MTSLNYVETPEELNDLARELSSASIIAVDTESDSMYAYREKVCFIQFHAAGRTSVVDSVVLRDLDVLAPIFADPNIVKVLHGADYDVVCLSRDFGFTFTGLYDTMLAAQFLNRDGVGLAALCLDYLDVELDKSHTRHNWGLRPVEPKHIDYLVDDVLYLEELRSLTRADLEAADVFEEAALEFERATTLEWSGTGFDPDGYLRIKGFRELDETARRVLRELYVVRDEIGHDVDLPPTRVLNNNLLLFLARHTPRSNAQLRGLRRLSSRVARYADRIVGAVHAGLKSDVPSAKPPRKPGRTRNQVRLENRLRDWRKRAAEKRRVPNIVVLPNHVLNEIVANPPAKHSDLTRLPFFGEKRFRLYGDAIFSIIADDRG